ncbi:ubiquitin-related domain-containing protein [Podospora appendiculata]|uniref:Ubiquitin-related domain-containing protein n=1 Tax=Podospora appendiculata TaxID=314037 RepID=A0AAE1C6X1_9PEZI|nr:ubiquitin-related domain-containing protein [Podospora appendiculata]
MGQSDLEVLIDMGFERPRAELAVKKSGGLQGALNWLEENQDKPLEELQAAAAAAAEDEEEGGPSIATLEGADAKSLLCKECGKRFRNKELASYHASKTDHTDFEESTEEIAPLTEEEKKARLEELRQKMLEKKANKALEEKEEAKRNEKIRQKSTKEVQDIKEELARKEQIKEAEKKRQEKLADIEAKKRIKDKIEADKQERKRKAEEAKAAREGRAIQAPAAPVVAASAPRAAVSHNEARLRLQLPSGNVVKTFPADTTLFEVAAQLEAENGKPVTSFSMNYPRKTFSSGVDFGQTLKEAGLVPSAVLIIK